MGDDGDDLGFASFPLAERGREAAGLTSIDLGTVSEGGQNTVRLHSWPGCPGSYAQGIELVDEDEVVVEVHGPG